MSQFRPCDVCGECEYHEEGGFYYCDSCNTQSQGMRVIEASTDQFNLTGGQRSIYQKIDRTVAVNEKEEVDYGIPWTTHDAFGLLLQAQSVELVKLGAPPTLPILTEKLWKRYEERRAGTPKPRLRDLTKDKSKGIPPITQWRTYRKRHGKWPTTVDTEVLSKEERIEWKIQNGVSPEDAEEEEKETEKEQKEKEEKGEDIDKNTRDQLDIAERTAYEHIQRMRMEYSLCFMYIALLHMESHITLGDLHRWCEQCVVPYLNPLHYFPENRKFFDSDLMTFACVKRVPSPSNIRKDSGRLIVFLQLNPFPNVDLHRLISRYVLDLNLPVEILKLASKLMALVKISNVIYAPRKEDTNSILIPNYEAFAVSILLMTLKMIFRLDGVTEFLLSHLVQELENLPETRVKNHSTDTFRFKEWFQFSTDALLKMKSREFPTSKEIEESDGDANGGFPRDVSYLARAYSHNLVNKKGSERRRDLPTRDLIDELQNSLADLLLTDADLSVPHSTNTASSFPASASLGMEGVVDDALADAEWRQSLRPDLNPKTRTNSVTSRRLSEKELGILTDANLQREIIMNDMVLLKLKMPSYEIDENGYPVCRWTGDEASSDPERKLENNRSCLESLFSHQSQYCFLIERETDKEKTKIGKDGEEKRTSYLVNEAVFHTSTTVGVLVELFSRMLGQLPNELMLDIYRIEHDFPIPD